MEDKYYQPSIEEFHVGFECESNYILINNSEKDKSKFIQFTFTRDNLAYMIDAYVEDAYPNEFRVKYLDSEDIESLGFYKTAEYGKYIEFNDNIKAFNPSSTKLLYNTDTNLMNIESFTFEEESSLPLFHGIVKNKSELVRLLKQLSIIK